MRIGGNMMRNRNIRQEFIDDTVRVSIEVYQELQQIWLNDELMLEPSAIEAYQLACKLQLQDAAIWIKLNTTQYERGFETWCWGLDTGTFDGNVICRRVDGTYGATALTNVPRSVIQSSPDGHEWGYGGSGPHDLALDILNWFCPPVDESDRIDCFKGYCSQKAWKLKHRFCQDFIASMPRFGGNISESVIREWILQQSTLLLLTIDTD